MLYVNIQFPIGFKRRTLSTQTVSLRYLIINTTLTSQWEGMANKYISFPIHFST